MKIGGKKEWESQDLYIEGKRAWEEQSFFLFFTKTKRYIHSEDVAFWIKRSLTVSGQTSLLALLPQGIYQPDKNI